MAYELRISDWRSAVCSSVLKRGSLSCVEVVDAPAPCMEGLMKMSWWVLGLIVLAAGGAGLAIQQQADAPAPSQPPFDDPFDPPAPTSAERRAGQAWVSPCRPRWTRHHHKEKIHRNKQ